MLLMVKNAPHFQLFISLDKIIRSMCSGARQSYCSNMVVCIVLDEMIQFDLLHRSVSVNMTDNENQGTHDPIGVSCQKLCETIYNNC